MFCVGLELAELICVKYSDGAIIDNHHILANININIIFAKKC